MQGGWLGATAIGNQLLFIGAILYESTPLWLTWTVFVVACLLSMITMLAMLKWLERITKYINLNFIKMKKIIYFLLLLLYHLRQ